MGLDAAIITTENYSVEWWYLIYEKLKPGAHVAFIGFVAKSHRLICAMENAGFEIRDTLMWISEDRTMPIPLGRKAIDGNNAENVMKYGVGGINIAASRIMAEQESDMPQLVKPAGVAGQERKKTLRRVANPVGRWPANIIHDGSQSVVAGFPFTKSGPVFPCQDGSASRFFQTAKDIDELTAYVTRLILPPNGLLLRL